MSLRQAILKVAVHEFLHEALSHQSHKDMAMHAASVSIDETGRTAAQRISDHVFGDKDRITIPLQAGDTTPHPLVARHLEEAGYKIKDYSAGIATKKTMVGNPSKGIPMQEKHVDVSIGKALAETKAPEAVVKTFMNDPKRTAAKSSIPLKVVISRHPHDIAAMSTGQNWESCQTLGGDVKNSQGETIRSHVHDGIMNDYVPSAIESGAHIAYLVKHEDDVDKHFAPLARMNIPTFTGKHYETGENHTILRPSGEAYPSHISGLHETIDSWAKKNFPGKPGIDMYRRDPGCYPEGKMVENNFDHDNSMHRLKSGDHFVLAENTDSKFIHSAINHVAKNGFVGIQHFGGNEGFQTEHHDNLVRQLQNTPHEHIHTPSYVDASYSISRKSDAGLDHVVSHMMFLHNRPDHLPKFIERVHADKSAMELADNVSQIDQLRNSSKPKYTNHVMAVVGKYMSNPDLHRDISLVNSVTHRISKSKDVTPDIHSTIADAITSSDSPVHINEFSSTVSNMLAPSSTTDQGIQKRIATHIMKSTQDPVHESLAPRAVRHAMRIAASNPDMHHLITLSHLRTAVSGGSVSKEVSDFLSNQTPESLSKLNP